jgi:NMD protein affecting ribosome stability and mRNA decay
MSRHAKATQTNPVRHDRLIQEHQHDPYAAGGKPKEPAACPECGAVFHEGRWCWGEPPAGAQAVLCPACKRIRDNFPAGIVHIGGDFTAAEKDETMRLINHEAQAEATDHPIERIMEVEEEDGGVVITTTSVHLARRIGDALQRAHRGRLDVHYGESENFVRVYFWH